MSTKPDIPPDELARLWAEYARTRSAMLRNRLATVYMPLAERIVDLVLNKLPRHVDRGALAGVASLGLLDAVTKFDPARGFAFSTFATPRIRGAIFDEVRRLDHIPRQLRDRHRWTKRVEAALTNELGRPPTDEELQAKCPPTAIRGRERMTRTVPAMVMMSRKQTGEEGETDARFGELIDTKAVDPADAAGRNDLPMLFLREFGVSGAIFSKLRFIEGRPLHEIAPHLRVSTAGLMVRQRVMFQKLRTRFTDAGLKQMLA